MRSSVRGKKIIVRLHFEINLLYRTKLAIILKMWLTNYISLWIGNSNVSSVYLGTLMLTRRKIFLAHLWHFKVISFEDSTFIHSLFSLYQHLFQNTCNKPYGLTKSLSPIMERTPAELESRGPILVFAFSHVTHMFVDVFSKNRNILGLEAFEVSL